MLRPAPPTLAWSELSWLMSLTVPLWLPGIAGRLLLRRIVGKDLRSAVRPQERAFVSEVFARVVDVLFRRPLRPTSACTFWTAS